MLLTTTGTIEGHQIERYLGIVSSEVVLGANAIKDMMAGFRDFFGGRSNSYERAFRKPVKQRCVNLKTVHAPWALMRSLGFDWTSRR